MGKGAQLGEKEEEKKYLIDMYKWRSNSLFGLLSSCVANDLVESRFFELHGEINALSH